MKKSHLDAKFTEFKVSGRNFKQFNLVACGKPLLNEVLLAKKILEILEES